MAKKSQKHQVQNATELLLQAPSHKKTHRLAIPLILATLTFASVSLVYLKNSFNLPKDTPLNQPSPPANSQDIIEQDLISLPQPRYSSTASIEQVLQKRTDHKAFTPSSLKITDISQLLWAMQGINTQWGDRTSPSAKSVYPLTLYLLADNITDLDQGLYEYIPGNIEIVHKLKPTLLGPVKEKLNDSLSQSSLLQAPALFIIAADFDKLAQNYPEDVSSQHLAYLEAGHAAQNAFLQAESLNLGFSVIIGVFNRQEVSQNLSLPPNQTPIYILPFGQPQP